MTLHDMLTAHINTYERLNPEYDKLTLTASFVVPVFNSEASITSCVEHIAQQLQTERIREIILVNDGSTDTSAEIIEHLKQRFAKSIRIVTIHNKTRQYAAFTRNRGLEMCTGNLVYFLDSDILVPPDYLVKHMARHQQEGPCVTFSLRQDVPTANSAIASPPTNPSDFRDAILKKYTNLQDVPFQLDESHSIAELCLTCAVTYRRADLLKVKGCPENFKGWGFNDTAMAAKVIALGRNVIPITECLTQHLAHAPRSGNETAKWQEYARNKARYETMLQLPLVDTLHYMINDLDYTQSTSN